MAIAGLVQSLKILKMYGNLQTSFPDLEKVWKMKIKSAKDRKKSGVLLKAATSARLLSESFSAGLISSKFRLSQNAFCFRSRV